MTPLTKTLVIIPTLASFAVLCTLCGMAMAYSAQAEDPVTEPCVPAGIPATFTRIIDGDTFELQAHLPLGVHLDVTVRLAGIDTWEVRGIQKPKGDKATAATKTWAKAYPNVVLFPNGNGKYGRLLARVCPPGGGQCLDEVLRAGGHGKEE